jgi:hypothetical protein
VRGCLRVLGGGQSARGSPEPHADRLDCGSGDPRPSHRGASRAQQLGFATRTSHGSSGLSMQCSSTPRPRVLAPDGRPGLSLPVYLLAANSVLGTCILDAVFAAGPRGCFPVGSTHRRPAGQHRHWRRAFRGAAQQLAPRPSIRVLLLVAMFAGWCSRPSGRRPAWKPEANAHLA